VKKGVLADNLGIFVELCFNNVQRVGSTDLWLATFAYGLQLYLDFNGYVDIARGSALLLGLVLPENFDFPYLSSSIADFWRRWHITLGDWLRNYLYFPLGGSRRGLLRTCVNLLIVMLIAGIWHGSAWGFVVWGGSHGIALCIHRVTDVVSNNSKILRLFWHHPLGIILAWFLTQLTVFISWIWFRLPRIEDSALVMGNLWGHPADVQFIEKVYMEALNTSPNQVLWGLILIFVFMIVDYVFKRKLHLELTWQLKLVFVPLCFYVVWLLAPQGSLPYIYFDF
jgi:alginate O-acetyltransferase complex protein AlgI